jgi:hypothetical protein
LKEYSSFEKAEEGSRVDVKDDKKVEIIVLEGEERAEILNLL